MVMDELGELLGESRAIEMVRDKLRRLLERQRAGQRLPPVLIQGDTGTGKGLVARLLHRHGARSRGPFVDINCAAIPETLLEAELFGFERGAFTDARRAKPGLFQAAHGGVLFLDEIALLPESLQAKLLTAIEERAVRRLGSTRSEPADVWLISATNTDLRAAVRARRFREDLYHRLAVLTLDLPPLRARGRDVLLLAERFLARACAEYGLSPKTPGCRGPGAAAGVRVAREHPRAGECDRAGGGVHRHGGGDGGEPGLPAGARRRCQSGAPDGDVDGSGTRRCAWSSWRRSRRWGGTSHMRRQSWGSHGTPYMREWRSSACARITRTRRLQARNGPRRLPPAPRHLRPGFDGSGEVSLCCAWT